MWKCRKKKILYTGEKNPITIVRKGFLYAAIQCDGTVVAAGLKLKKYHKGDNVVSGYIDWNGGTYDTVNDCWVEGKDLYALCLENPDKANEFDEVCEWG